MSDESTNTAAQLPDDFTLDDVVGALTPAEIEAIKTSEFPEAIPGEEPAPADDQAAALAAQQQPVAPAQPEAPAALPEIPDTSAAQAEVARINDEISALTDRYDNGDLTRAEWMAAQNDLIAKQAAALSEIKAAEKIISATVEATQKQWYDGLDAYKAKGNEILWSPEHINGFDAALRLVSANPAYVGIPFERQYQLAHDLYAADHFARTGNRLPTSAGKEGARAMAEAQQPQMPTKRTDERPDAPITLGGLNGDTTVSVMEGTVGMLTRLDPEAAEAMFDKLTPEQQEAVLAQA